MPFFFVTVGILLIITGAKDTYVALGKQVASDFTGDRNFFVWIMALGSIGAVGYVPKLRGFSHAFMALVLVAMVLTNSRRADILTLISEGLNNPETPPRPSTGAASSATGTTPRTELATQPRAPETQGDTWLDTGTKLLKLGMSLYTGMPIP
jgi:hypothetical protein